MIKTDRTGFVRRLSLLWMAPLASVLLSCGAPHLQTVEASKATLTGSETTVLEQCIGEPQSITPSRTGAIWRYSSAQRRDTLGLTLQSPQSDPKAEETACVFDFVAIDGRIVSVQSTNRAGWGFGSITRCSKLVEKCAYSGQQSSSTSQSART